MVIEYFVYILHYNPEQWGTAQPGDDHQGGLGRMSSVRSAVPSDLLDKPFSHLLQAMNVGITFLLAVLAILLGQTQDPHTDMAVVQQMQQCEEFLHQEMSQLWQEVEQRALVKAFLSSVSDWFFWASLAALLLKFCMQNQLGSSSCPEQDNCNNNDRDDSEENEDLKGAQNAARSLAWLTLFSVQELPDLSRNLKQLLGDLINRDFSQSTLTPKISQHTGMNNTHESHKNYIFSQLLVFLQPSPGPSSILEQRHCGAAPREVL
ncbi:hypothetical protein HGM15179_007965 [Zosterops borbonicus]|uniref:Uncharacterized protein n=1 Tax=Zosterops borbonicus TaxID=364589 RepID=A0A8K1LMJ8_9PASS|nr:hypothetical protein HGM15179_007965 [Zosterops borbonicus]